MKKKASLPTGKTLDAILIAIVLIGVVCLAGLSIFVFGGFLAD